MSKSRLAWNSNSIEVSNRKSTLGKKFAKNIKQLSIVETPKKKQTK